MIEYYPTKINIQHAIMSACAHGRANIAKWLTQNYQVDFDPDHEFRWAGERGQIEIVKWLVQDYQINVHAIDEGAFKTVCAFGHDEIIDWFMEEYRYSQSRYYYHNNTAYILNHEPLKEWKSCTILDCPVIYDGELDEPAVIAFMATLKKPKSARS